VQVAHDAKLGDHLVDAQGRTLYLFEADHGMTTACTGGCVTEWPAATATKASAGKGVEAAKLTTASGEAANQLAYNGHLLYRFAGDKAAGDTNGIGIPKWYAVSPKGTSIETD
jgi:predicted lipoprotein with Yx(FWY)xxD motif